MTKENLGSRHRGEENSMIDRFKIETFFNIVRGTRLVVRKKGLKKEKRGEKLIIRPTRNFYFGFYR